MHIPHATTDPFCCAAVLGVETVWNEFVLQSLLRLTGLKTEGQEKCSLTLKLFEKYFTESWRRRYEISAGKCHCHHSSRTYAALLGSGW